MLTKAKDAGTMKKIEAKNAFHEFNLLLESQSCRKWAQGCVLCQDGSKYYISDEFKEGYFVV